MVNLPVQSMLFLFPSDFSSYHMKGSGTMLSSSLSLYQFVVHAEGDGLRDVFGVEFLEEQSLAGFQGVERDVFVLGNLFHCVALHESC